LFFKVAKATNLCFPKDSFFIQLNICNTLAMGAVDFQLFCFGAKIVSNMKKVLYQNATFCKNFFVNSTNFWFTGVKLAINCVFFN